jgi:hypothetical protein
MAQYQGISTSNIKETERRPIAWQKHRHDVRMQIILPITIGIIIVLALSILVVLGSNAQVSQGADVALIWLIVPMLVVTLLFLIILGGLVYGVTKLLIATPGFMRRVQDYSIIAQYRISEFTDKLVSPMLKIKTKKASWGTLLRNIKRG